MLALLVFFSVHPFLNSANFLAQTFSSESWMVVVLALTIMAFLSINTTRNPSFPFWGGFFFFKLNFPTNFSLIGVR